MRRRSASDSPGTPRDASASRRRSSTLPSTSRLMSRAGRTAHHWSWTVASASTTSSAAVTRCQWAGSDPLMVAYHDQEWGVPLHDDDRLFEMLCLEGAQAGLSWSTIL